MKTGPWRVIFLGTPQFAVPSLQALLNAGEEVVAVITQPDRPRGRGQKVTPSPVKELALEQGLTVLQPVRLKDPEFVGRLRDLAPELMVVTAYGRILTHEMLAIPSVGFLNVHASLLPRHRGSAPINWALIRGDEETGVTIMWVTYEVDTGPLFLQERVPILPEDNAGTLAAKLADGPTYALHMTRQAVDESVDNDFKTQFRRELEINAELRDCYDSREGVAAFLEKRQAVFKGE